ncbi:hypothetical protein ACMD2_20092 [Ananas comosus]|uniref:Secreted protein n=1 Tax=Ananas comosus TaxID=4615 RepID=A0A199V5H8_ANACO|nr:hypothetical protein ACMD2_20092 [Ananas comosus]
MVLTINFALISSLVLVAGLETCWQDTDFMELHDRSTGSSQASLAEHCGTGKANPCFSSKKWNSNDTAVENALITCYPSREIWIHVGTVC